MSKLGKFCIKILILGIIMTIIGTVILAVEALNGFIDDIPDLDIGSNNQAIAITTYGATEVSEIPIDTEYGVYETMRATNASPDEIQELDISISTGNFDIIPGDSFMLFANGLNEDYLRFEINNGCLEVKYSPNFELFNLDWLSASPEIMLFVPAKIYDKVNINMSAGTASITEIVANDFIFNISAGDAYITNVTACNSADIKMSAGNSVFNNCFFDNSSNIKVSAGEMVFDDCYFTGKNDMKVTAGTLQMYINENSAYYDISANKSTGSLYINDEEVNNSYNIKSTVVDPIGAINVDVRAGSCYIVFDDD